MYYRNTFIFYIVIKNYALIALLTLAIISGIFIYFTIKSNEELKNKWSISEKNYKASNQKNLAYQLTVEQLNNSKDSLDKKLVEFKRRNGLKDSKINSLMIIIDSLRKQDTIRLKDTIFVKDLKIDTIIGDKWIKKKLKLRYPNIIIIDEEIYNEKNISWSNRRETIDAPRKFFLCRWFQKKQTVVEIKIEDLNPYFKTKEFKYNTIIK